MALNRSFLLKASALIPVAAATYYGLSNNKIQKRANPSYPREKEDITETGFNSENGFSRTEAFWRGKANKFTMKHNDKKTDWLNAIREDLGSKWEEYLKIEDKESGKGWFFVSYEKAARATLEWCDYFSETASGEVRKSMNEKLCTPDNK